MELVLSKRDSVPTRTIREPSSGTQNSLDSPLSDEEPPERPQLQEESSSNTVRQHTERPTYLSLPSPRFFLRGPHTTTPPTSSNSPPGSPLTAFDSSNARGSNSSASSPVIFERELFVLVVDDDQVTRTLMTRLLTRLGCHVTTADNGEAALDLILGQNSRTPSEASGNLGLVLEECSNVTEEGRFAVIFLDNQMPLLSGLNTVAKLRSLGRKDFVVGVTGEVVRIFTVVRH